MLSINPLQSQADSLRVGKTRVEIARLRAGFLKTAARLTKLAALLCPVQWLDYHEALPGEVASETVSGDEFFPAFVISLDIIASDMPRISPTVFYLWRIDGPDMDAVSMGCFPSADAAKSVAETYLETLKNEVSR